MTLSTYKKLLSWPVSTLVDLLLVAGKVDSLDTSGLRLSDGGSGDSRSGSSSEGCESASLNSRSRLASQSRSDSGDGAGGHLVLRGVVYN